MSDELRGFLCLQRTSCGGPWQTEPRVEDRRRARGEQRPLGHVIVDLLGGQAVRVLQ